VLAPLLFTLLTGLVLVVPIILTVHQITQGSDRSRRGATFRAQLRQDGIPVPGWVAQLPIAGEYLDRWWQTNLSNEGEWLRGVNMESVGVCPYRRVFLREPSRLRHFKSLARNPRAQGQGNGFCPALCNVGWHAHRFGRPLRS
jgi:hypothetical protein